MLDGTDGLEGIIGGMEFLGDIVRYSIAVGPHACWWTNPINEARGLWGG